MLVASRFLLACSLLSLVSCGPGGQQAPRESGIDTAGHNWASGGRASDEQHYSPMEEISDKTVGRLGLAWSLDLEGEHTLEATPLAVDGVLYFSGQMAKVYAVEAATGKLLWTHDPESWKQRDIHQRYLFPANRGVAYWDGKIFVGTLDGRLVALDARTGKVEWEVLTIDPASKRYIAGAPRAYKGKVLIGNGGGDYGERGYITAYDTNSGKQLWRFYTTPGDPAKGFEDDAQRMAAKTWRGEYWKTGTGGTVWDGFTYDPDLNRVYVGTGNSGPYNPEQRSPGGGDNLFLASIVALDADTGKYIWHYQVNPREAWDFKATAGIVLASLKINGKDRRVLMQAPTNGFFYVIDRETGKLLSAEKVGKVTWAERIDLKTGRPVEAKNIRYQDGPVTFWPSPYGAHNWQPMSYNPETGLVYIPYMKNAARYEISKNPIFGAGASFTIVKEDPDDMTGSLIAWDPVAQKMRWQVKRDKMWNGGTLTSRGNLVFQGDADGNFHAYDARTGKPLWKFDAKLGIIGAPITYEANGRQYVSILVGFGGATAIQGQFLKTGWKYGLQPRRLLTFALDATTPLPATPPADMTINALDDPALRIDPGLVAKGAGLYGQKACVICHGIDLKSPGVPAPDLRESGVALEFSGFYAFLKSGALMQNGMPKYDELKPDEAKALYMYIRDGARREKEGRSNSPSSGAGKF